MKGNREFKSDVFSMLMEEPTYALEVYNVLNDSGYNKPEEVEVIPLEGYVSLSVKNDAAFIIGMDMNFYEHQSTYNRNMPLRGLLYCAETLAQRIKEQKLDLYGRKQIKIHNPRFVVFYNGTEDRPPKEVMKLSDAYYRNTDQPELELVSVVYNINPRKNQHLLNASKVLEGYTTFVELVRNNEALGMALDKAIDLAIEECIRRHILEDFFQHRKDEVKKVTQLDFTWEIREKLIARDAREEGIEEGREQLCVELYQKGLISVLDAASSLGISEEAFLNMIG